MGEDLYDGEFNFGGEAYELRGRTAAYEMGNGC